MRTKLTLGLAALLAALGPSAATANLYARTTVIATDGSSDYPSVQDAMSNIGQWCLGGPSAGAPCVLKFAPGVYTLTAPLILVPYLDLEGSGSNASKLLGQVKVASNTVSEVRSITIQNTGASVTDAPFYCGYEAAFSTISLKDVTVSGTGTPGAYITSACTASIDRSVVSGAGASGEVYGLFFNNGDATGSLTVANSTIMASGGTNSYGVYLRYHGGIAGAIRIRESNISAFNATGLDIGIKNISNYVDFSDLDVKAGDVAIQHGPTTLSSGLVNLSGSRLQAPTAFANVGGYAFIATTRVDGALSGGSYRCVAVYAAGTMGPVTCPQ